MQRTLVVLASSGIVLTGAFLAVTLIRLPSSRVTPLPTNTPTNTTGLPLSAPTDFSISLYAKDLGVPRVIIADPTGVPVVSLMGAGKVVALPDANRDGVADQTVTVVEGLEAPHGLAFRCETSATCKLYVAEYNQIDMFDYDQTTRTATNKTKIIDVPVCDSVEGCHTTRTLMFLPKPHDDQLLISVGSSCNACTEADDSRARILIANADGTNLRTYADGLRNSVFMATHPQTGETWATENGRDLIGDDIPPDEVNIIEEGKFYGWPNCYGKNVQDTDFDNSQVAKQICASAEPSQIDIQAHSAVLGLTFIPEQGWPKTLANHLLVALHGSWNRSKPTGYKVISYALDADGEPLDVTYLPTDFLTGFLRDNDEVIGRPVGLLAATGGTLYVTDDKAGNVYRLQYVGK